MLKNSFPSSWTIGLAHTCFSSHSNVIEIPTAQEQYKCTDSTEQIKINVAIF